MPNRTAQIRTVSIRTLPSRPSLDHYRREAKRWLRAIRACDDAAQRRLGAVLDAIPEPLGLSHVHLALAREHGFNSWPRFVRHLDRIQRRANGRSPFEAATFAIDEGDVEALEVALRRPGALEGGPENGRGLLHHASGSATKGRPHASALITALLEAGADPNEGSDQDLGATPLHFAATVDHDVAVALLLEAGARVDIDAMGAGGTPLAHALFYGCCRTAERLAARGLHPHNLRVCAGLGLDDDVAGFFEEGGRLRPEAGVRREFYRPHDEFIARPTTDDPQEIVDEALYYATVNRRVSTIDALLDRGADVNAMVHFSTPLHSAAFAGDRSLVDRLLERGAVPSLRDRAYDALPWGWAWHNGQTDVMRHLQHLAAPRDLETAARIGAVDHVRALAQEAGETQLARSLVAAIDSQKPACEAALRSAGAQIGVGGPQSICTAARIGSVREVQALLDVGADLSEALRVASRHRRANVVELCLARGARPTIHDACALGLRPLVDAYLEGGGDIEAADAVGERPIHCAVRGAQLEIVKHLLDEGADASSNYDLDSHGPRTLHLAATIGAEPPLIDLLIAYGAEINEPTNAGTPLDCARRENNMEIAEYLVQLGALTRHDTPGAW